MYIFSSEKFVRLRDHGQFGKPLIFVVFCSLLLLSFCLFYMVLDLKTKCDRLATSRKLKLKTWGHFIVSCTATVYNGNI